MNGNGASYIPTFSQPFSTQGNISVPTEEIRLEESTSATNRENRLMLKGRKVFVQRDYSLGTVVQFHRKFPAELDGLIEPEHFTTLICQLNQFYYEAEALSGSVICQNCLACFTAFFLYQCVESHYDKMMVKVSKYIESQNASIWNSRGLNVGDPLERGLRVLEITITENS